MNPEAPKTPRPPSTQPPRPPSIELPSPATAPLQTELVASEWSEANRDYLMACLQQLKGILQHSPTVRMADDELVVAARERMPSPPALEQMVEAFGLSTFERSVLLMAVAPELDPEFGDVVSRTLADKKYTRPNLGLAMAHLDGADWDAFTPGSPLRRWGLIDLQPGPILAKRPILCPERTLHHLLGASVIEPQLAERVRPIPEQPPVPASRMSVVQACVEAWSKDPVPVVLLIGREVNPLLQTAEASAKQLGGRGLRLRIDDLPTTSSERTRFLTMLGLEMALERAFLIIDAFEAGPEHLGPLRALVEDASGGIAVLSRAPIALGQANVQRVEIRSASSEEQRKAWQHVLAEASDEVIDRFVATFSLEPDVIVGLTVGTGPLDEASAWQAAQDHGRPRMLEFARPMQTETTFADLVLPEFQTTLLRDIVAHARRRGTVYDRWGLGLSTRRGTGITALFSGPSGTGKTMAAEVVANELDLDLYRIDLAALHTGGMGETERNLRSVFDSAEMSGAVLLIDEADALFSKRSDSAAGVDRIANLEVGHMLQQLEDFRGLAILTTNLKGQLDPSLLRRLRFVVDFPMPDSDLRERLWRKVFPATVPTAPDFDPDAARVPAAYRGQHPQHRSRRRIRRR